MNEEHIKEEFDVEPFKPLRLHLVSGKTLDVLQPNAVMTLRDRLLLFINPSSEGRSAEGYNIVSYQNIERIEQLAIGKRPNGKRSSR